MSRAERGEFAYFTYDKANERVDASQGDFGKRQKKRGLERFPYSSGLTLPLPASDTPVLSSGADALDVLRARYSSASRTVSRSVVPDLFSENRSAKEREESSSSQFSMWKQTCGGSCCLSGAGEYILSCSSLAPIP